MLGRGNLPHLQLAIYVHILVTSYTGEGIHNFTHIFLFMIHLNLNSQLLVILFKFITLKNLGWGFESVVDPFFSLGFK